MNNGYLAALLRGLCVDLAGKPHFVIAGPGGKIPAGAMAVDLPPEQNAAAPPPEKTAEIIRSAYNAWKAETGIAPEAGRVLLPSCAAIHAGGSAGGATALFWTGGSFDSARKRLAEGDASPQIESVAITAAAVLPEERAAVVKNRIAVVTGGAQGIGEEISRSLAAAGALVFIADLNLEGAEKLAGEINAAEKRTAALAVKVNVADEASVEAMFAAIAETAGGLDLCVSNAGVLKAGSVLEQEIADFKFVTDINYTGFFVVSKFAGRLLKAQHYGAPRWKTDIIQINSKSGLEGSNKNGAYAGGKFGGIGLAASFAMELVEYNIKVNAVCPGNFLDGPLWSHPEKGLFVQYLRAGKVPGAKSAADVRAFYESKVPMKRGCTGKDLVRAIYYIVEQEYETGQAVPVTGGQVMLH
ncbi:MAG: SDR family NAD(P)-dependent oxidoreductase [Treponema sp.]|nr:SDR family NAD(P)-dependent oxidoreductase [Treponema sp.]